MYFVELEPPAVRRGEGGQIRQHAAGLRELGTSQPCKGKVIGVSLHDPG